MRLAIADPPYLGKAAMFYGTARGRFNAGGRFNRWKKADLHHEADLWDTVDAHRDMVDTLVREYDGFAIAMLPDNLFEYLTFVPRECRIAVWHNPRVMATGSHPRRRWEAVIIRRAPGRCRVTDVPVATSDVFTASNIAGSQRRGTFFAGQKPPAWTTWVLDMLGYCQTHDTVDDLFHGSGAVSTAIAQGRLPAECKCR